MGVPMRDLIAVLLDVAMEQSRDGAEAAALAVQCGWAWPGTVRQPDGTGNGDGYGTGYGYGDGGPDA